MRFELFSCTKVLLRENSNIPHLLSSLISCKPCVLGTHLEDKRLGLKFRQEGIESLLAFYRASILTTWLLCRKERLGVSFFSSILKVKQEPCSKALCSCFQQGLLAEELSCSQTTQTHRRLIFSGFTCCWVAGA